MVELKNEEGEVFRRGKNLRVITDYARSFKWSVTKLRRTGRTLHVSFPEGSYCTTLFADPTVLKDWIDGRIKYGRGKFARF